MSKPMTRFKLKWADVARPGGMGASCDRALLAWRWLAVAAAKHRQCVRWGEHSPFSILSASPGTLGLQRPAPLESIGDLHRRLQYAVLAHPDGPMVEPWREATGLRFDGARVIPGLHSGTCAEVYALFDEVPRRARLKPVLTAAQLNYVHADAREAYGVRLSLGYDFSFRADLRFGVDGSVWDHRLTEERPGEAINVFLARAHRFLVAVLDDPAASLIEPTYQPEPAHPWGTYRSRHSGRCPQIETHLCNARCAWVLVSLHETRAEAEDAVLKQALPLGGASEER